MTFVKDIMAFMENLAPAYMKMGNDRVGLNCGHPDAPVSTVLISLDASTAACREAKEVGAQLLLTHHALLYHPDFITEYTEAGTNTLFLIENHIAHFNAHTNLDCAPGGVNDCFANRLGLKNIEVISPDGTDSQGRPYGLLRSGTVETQSLTEFMALVKEKLGCDTLKYTDSGKPVHKVAVGGGSCGSELYKAAMAGCDTFVTADCAYHQHFDAQFRGMNLIDAGHWHTENPVCAMLAEKLQAAFPDVQVLISKENRDPAKFF